MEDDLIRRFENYKNVWRRVTEISDETARGVIPQGNSPAPEYGSFCLVPNPKCKSRATRFLPGL